MAASTRTCPRNGTALLEATPLRHALCLIATAVCLFTNCSDTSAPAIPIPAALLIVSGNQQVATVGRELPELLVVRVVDEAGEPVAGQVVNFRVTKGGGDVFAGVATTNDAGEARERWTLGTVAGEPQEVQARAVDTQTGEALVFGTFSAEAVADAAVQLQVATADAQSATAGTAVGTVPSVVVADQYSNPVAGVAVTFAVTSGGGVVDPITAVLTDANGIAAVTSWTLGTTVGANTLTATSVGLTGSPATFSATGTVDAAAILAISAGDAQSATVGTAVATAPSVVVTDQQQNPVAGVAVTFAVASGGGAVDPITAVLTDANGIAAVTSWTLGTTVGEDTLTATSAGLTGSPATFTATGTVDAAATIAIDAGDAQSATVGTTVTTAPSAVVTDQYGNPVAGVAVTFAVASGGGVVDPITALLTDANGIATVTSWTLGTIAGTNTLTATSGGLSGSPAILTAMGTADVATTLAIDAGDGQDGPVGFDLLTAPAVFVSDQYGNPVSDVEVTFSVTAGGGTVDPVTAVATDENGRAAAKSWTLGSALGTNTLTATADVLTPNQVTFTATGHEPASTITLGIGHACILSSWGSAFCWGVNSSGRLGDGTTENRSTPTEVAGGLSFNSLSAGSHHTCGLTPLGAAHCWGLNSAGQLGDGTTTNRLSPVAVAGGLTFAQITGGDEYTCGLTTSGAAYCWGLNRHRVVRPEDEFRGGQLGDGTFDGPRLTPVAVTGGLIFTSLSAGSWHTCGITSDGTGYCWGNNLFGQLGTGTGSVAAPTAILGGLKWALLSASEEHTCGIADDTMTYCWGANGVGQLGDGTTGAHGTPAPVSPAVTFSSIDVGHWNYTCGLTAAGAAYCWGVNSASGNLGVGDQEIRLSPTPVVSGLTFTSISAGGFTCALTPAGTGYCWGKNSNGELGNGTTTSSTTPVLVIGIR